MYQREAVDNVIITTNIFCPTSFLSTLILGSRDGSVMIWWDGGPAYKLLHKLQKKHKTSIEEVISELHKLRKFQSKSYTTGSGRGVSNWFLVKSCAIWP